MLPDRNELKVFAAWNSVYQSTIYPLMDLYSKLRGNLDILRPFSVPTCSPWQMLSSEKKLGAPVHNIRSGAMSLSEEEKDAQSIIINNNIKFVSR